MSIPIASSTSVKAVGPSSSSHSKPSFVFGCVLRFCRLSDLGPSYDELWTVVGASKSSVHGDESRVDPGRLSRPAFFCFILDVILPTDESVKELAVRLRLSRLVSARVEIECKHG